MKKLFIVIAAVIAVVIIALGATFAVSMYGSPLAKARTARVAGEYIAAEYQNTDYALDRVSYNFKDGCYHAHIVSPSSADSYFTLSYRANGTLVYDSYESQVVNLYNTADRLNREYRALTDAVFDSPGYPYVSDIAFGELVIIEEEYINHEDAPAYALSQNALELDGVYDIRELGARAGRILVYADDADVSVERAAEIMLGLKRIMDEAGAPFCALHFILEYPRPEDGSMRPEGRVEVMDIPYGEIYEDGMSQRVEQYDALARAHHAAADAQKEQAAP